MAVITSYAGVPEITSMEQAIALVREILDEIKPWPELVEVTEPARLPGRIVSAPHPDYSLSRPVIKKMTVIHSAVTLELIKRNLRPRIPNLMLVAGQAAIFIWDDRVFQVIED